MKRSSLGALAALLLALVLWPVVALGQPAKPAPAPAQPAKPAPAEPGEEPAAAPTEAGEAGEAGKPKEPNAEAPPPPARKPQEKAAPQAESERTYNLFGQSEVSAYKDDQAVQVITPGIVVGAEDPVKGWSVAGSMLVDVVTAASPDIVATASPRWNEVRYVPGIAGQGKAGDVTLAGSAGASIEPDYLAIGAGFGTSFDLRQKTVTPSFRYDFGYDLAGRWGTPFSVFANRIHRHGLSSSVAFVIDKTSILVPTLDVVLEFGDTSKPYRYLPTFAPGVDVENGASVEDVNRLRTPMRVSESVPDNRQRYALSALYAKRWSDVTMRIEERLYVDSWGLLATTTDFRLPIDLGRVARIWPHARFHAQKGVSFWERAYVAEPGNLGVQAPALRIGDREAGPILAMTGGGGVRFLLDGDRMGLSLQADAIYTRFLDHIYASDRLAGFGVVTYDVVVE